MGRFILVYDFEDYDVPGKKAETFDTEDGLHKRVNEIATAHPNSFEIEFSGYLQYEFEYAPEEVVTQYKPKRI